MGLDLSHFIPIINQNEEEYLDYIKITELKISPEYVELNRQFIVDKDCEEFGVSKVIYFQQEGYQRKGMNSKFYSDFENDKLYFDLESLRKAYNYLEADHISSLKELQQNFQENFINNFIEGKSIFQVSW
jgi:hypothetical protein